MCQWLWDIVTPNSQGQCSLFKIANNKKVHVSETGSKRKNEEMLVIHMTDQGWFKTRLLTQETIINQKKAGKIFPSQLEKKNSKTKKKSISHSFKK